MADRWLEKEGTATPYKEWARSWRQTIECEFGKYPVLTAHIHKVRVYEDGNVEFFPLPDVVIPMDTLSAEDLDDAMVIQKKLTKLIGLKVHKEKVNE